MALIARRVPNTIGSVLLRPVRPPPPSSTPHIRFFTQKQALLFKQKHPLLLYTRSSSPRPQLPYLSQPSRLAALPRGPPLQRQIARLLSTENKRYVKEQFWLFTKWSVTGYIMILLGSTAWYFWQQDLIEQQYPSPPEWSYWTRTHFRHAHRMLDPDCEGLGFVKWGDVAQQLRYCLRRLEDPNTDGRDLVLVTNATGNAGHVEVQGIDSCSYDVSNKSYPWRQGYFDVVMGCARAAEFMQDCVVDKTTGLLWPKSMVVGPSNPNPRPPAVGSPPAPSEDDCIISYAPPEMFYLRILAGQGFSTNQRLQAALAYANWLEVKGLQDTAEDVYKWAVDIAASALPEPDALVDTKSGIIKVHSTEATSSTTIPSPNLLKAATALASHHARNGNPNAALPVYLSVLRARHSAPIDTSLSATDQIQYDASSNTDYGHVWSLLKGLIRKDEYPPEPPSGDTPFLRTSTTEKDCTEAELMLYIGEILFATSSTRNPDEGLGWTKRAVAVAQDAIAQKSISPEERAACKSCLTAGVSNWGLMVARLLKAEREREASSPTTSSTSWTSWLGFGGSKNKDEAGETRWEKEEKEVEALRIKLVNQGIDELMAASKGVPGGTWMG